MLNVEDPREANIVAGLGGARMPVLGARIVAGDVQKAVEVMRAGKALVCTGFRLSASRRVESR